MSLCHHNHKVEDTRGRSILKATTGRLIEILVGTLVQGSFLHYVFGLPFAYEVGFLMTLAEELTCFIICYFNDRLWNRVQFGRKIIDIPSNGGMSEREKGYIAGFLDADGNLGIGRRHKQNKKYTNYFPRIALSNSRKEPLEYIHSLVKWNTKIQYSSKHHIGYIHCENRDHVKKFLLEIKDYLILKKDLAEKVLEFCNSRENQIKKKGKNKATITQQEINLFKWCRKRNSGKGIIGWGIHKKKKGR